MITKRGSINSHVKLVQRCGDVDGTYSFVLLNLIVAVKSCLNFVQKLFICCRPVRVRYEIKFEYSSVLMLEGQNKIAPNFEF